MMFPWRKQEVEVAEVPAEVSEPLKSTTIPESKSVIPNLVGKDNHAKGDRTPEEAGMKLIRRPLPQTIHTPRFLLRTIGLETAEWSKYLWSDSSGDQRFMRVASEA